MKAYAIVLNGNKVSEVGFKTLLASSSKVENPFKIERYDACQSNIAFDRLAKYKLKWEWPWDSEKFDPVTSMVFKPYKTRNPAARVACFLSHYELWVKCASQEEPFLILEHDAVFIEKLSNIVLDSYQILGINDPRGATRKCQLYHEVTQGGLREINAVPIIDSLSVPQGLAGNSAYIITPNAAEMLISRAEIYGAWPNDALMCFQLFPFLTQTKKYYTKVQGLPSTTSD